MLKPASCTPCGLVNISNGFIESEGEGTNGVVILGDTGGWNEYVDAKPFRPRSRGGSKLEEVFKLVQRDTGQPCTRGQFLMYNVVNCCPPGDRLEGSNLEREGVAGCSKNVDRVVGGFHTNKQKTILALGNIPLKFLTGVSGVYDEKQSVDFLRGFVFESKYGLVIPSFHPEYLRRGNGHLTPLLVEDMKRALSVAKGVYSSYSLHKEYTPPVYQVSPSVDEAWSFYYKAKDSVRLPLTYDIETTETGMTSEDDRDDLEETEIILVQFSLQVGTGIALPWNDLYLPVIHALFGLANPKANHNCFSRNTSVQMGDGTWKPIWQVKVGEEVTTAIQDQVVNRKVTSLFRVADTRLWFNVVVDGAYNRGAAAWGDTGTKCTPDHKWILNGGKRVKAEDLKVGDEVLLPKYGSNALINGTLLGDGYTNNGLLKFTHSNYEWAAAKAEHLGVNVTPTVSSSVWARETTLFTYNVTATIPKFWRDKFYDSEGCKRWVPPTSMRSLAIWYGDDGCFAHQTAATFSLHKFKPEDREKARLWFEQYFEGTCSIHNEAVLYLQKKASSLFFSSIARYLHPSMEYKLPEKYRGKYNGWMQEKVAQIGKVISSQPYTQNVDRGHLKYCLEVEETHTFFTRNGLVANCWNFDNPRLRAKGIQIEGKVHDTMWMFKHWHPRLPRGLQNVASVLGFPFPWKHMYGTNLPWYGCADVDAVQWILKYLPKLMVERGVWKGYKEHVYNLNPVFERSRRIGIPVDEGKRAEVATDFKARHGALHKELQNRIPDEVRNIEPKRKEWECAECKTWLASGKKVCNCGYKRVEVGRGEKWAERVRFDYGYKREPKEVADCYDQYNRLIVPIIASGKRVVPFESYLFKKHNLVYADFTGTDEDSGVPVKVERWATIEDFNGASGQLIKYLNWKREQIQIEMEEVVRDRQVNFQGRNPELTAKLGLLKERWKDYEVPKNLKTKKETTNKKELEEIYIKTGDEVLEMVMQMRSFETNLNNYIPNWKPAKDGRVHPVCGYTAPQGQINTWSPNSQNVSKHTEFGNEFRGIIQAPQGYCFVEADKKSFHVGTMGYCANDKDYIRFSQIDPHSILGSYIDPSVIGQSISLKWSDADILEAAKEFKKKCKQHKEKDPAHNVDVRQELAKPTVLGNQLELGARKLQRQNRRFIHWITEREKHAARGVGYSAEGLQNVINELFVKEQKFKEFIKEKAHIQKWLVNEFGRIQYFYDVFKFDWNERSRQWVRKDGEGARHPVAFEVQGAAFGMITEELLELERLGVCEEHNFIVTIHDSLMFMPEVGKRDKCVEVVNEVMSRPCKRLVNEATGPEGLKIGVEIAVGTNWKHWDTGTNPGGMKEIKL